MADSNLRGSFLTHLGYLAAFRTLIHATYGGRAEAGRDRIYQGLTGAVQQSRTYTALNVNKQVDLDAVRRSLRNAWGTELVMEMSLRHMTDEEILGLRNNWIAVQAYYVGYHAAQSLIVAQGQPRPQQHEKTQKQFAAQWCDRPVALPPWSFGASAQCHTNLPAGRTLDADIHPWSACTAATCWDIAGKALRTTRDDGIDERLKKRRLELQAEQRRAWTQAEQDRIAKGRRPRQTPTFHLPRLTAAQRREVADRVRTHTLLDYLYRLRLKTNYEDSAMFTDGPEVPGESMSAGQALRTISGTTMLLHELHIRQLVGQQSFLRLVADWLESNELPYPNVGLAARRSLLETS